MNTIDAQIAREWREQREEISRLKTQITDLLNFAQNSLAFAESCGDVYGAEQARAVIQSTTDAGLGR